MASRSKLFMFLIAGTCLALTGTSCAGSQQFNTLSRVNSEGVAYTVNGKVKIEIREIRVEAVNSKKSRSLSVLVLFEPISRAFSWRVTDAGESPDWRTVQFVHEQAAVLKGDEIIDFRAMWYRLFVRVYRGRASSIDDAEARALTAMSEGIDPERNLDKAQNVHVVSLAALDSDFLNAPLSVASSELAPRVTNVQWDGQHWVVTLKARWFATVTLDADFNLLSVKKLGDER
jgi:hypothetical protein